MRFLTSWRPCLRAYGSGETLILNSRPDTCTQTVASLNFKPLQPGGGPYIVVNADSRHLHSLPLPHTIDCVARRVDSLSITGVHGPVTHLAGQSVQ